MMGDSEVAKDCYERTLSFVADASEMHSIYLRLASIYLQEEQVTNIILCFKKFSIGQSPGLMDALYKCICQNVFFLFQFEKAKRQFLMACKKSPSCVSWLGVGISCYRVGVLFYFFNKNIFLLYEVRHGRWEL